MKFLSGMDPITKRKLWNCLNKIREKSSSFVLTTHSMEEVEQICTKAGIIVKGELKCIGNLQHLKASYGNGLSLLVKLTLKPDDIKMKKINQFIDFITNKFKNIELKENRNGFLNFHYKNNSIHSFSSIFEIIEINREKYSVEFYSVTQTNLEQIFLDFNIN